MKARKLPGEEDLHQKAILGFLLFGNAVGFFLAWGLLWIGVGVSIFSAFSIALLFVAAADGVLYLIFGGAMKSVDGLFGLHKTVDEPELSFQAQRDTAEALVRRHEFAEAAALFRQLIASPKNLNPENSAWRLADLYANNLGRPDDAVYWYRKAMSIIRTRQPEDYRNHPIWNELERGVASFAKVLATDDTDFQRRTEEIAKNIEAGLTDEARAACEDLVRRYPTRPDSEYWAAILDARVNNYAMASERYRRVLRRDPRHLKALFNLASALQKLDHLPEAKEIWTQYLDLARGDPGEAGFITEAEKILAEITAELKSTLDVTL